MLEHTIRLHTHKTIYLIHQKERSPKEIEALNIEDSELSSFKVSKAWDACCKLRQGRKCPVFLVPEAANNCRRVRGHAPPEIFLNLLLSDCWKCTIESTILFLWCCLLREPMLWWSAWAIISSYNSYINGWKSWRNKKIGRTRTDWTLAEVKSQWRSKFGIHENFWKLKSRVTFEKSVNAWEMLVSAWEREIASKCVRLTLNAWDLRAIEDITWSRGDTKFLFECWKYLSRVRAANEWERR